MARRTRLSVPTLLVSAGLLVVAMSGSTLAARPAAQDFYVPKPNPDAINQIAELRSSGQKAEAQLIESMVATPSAVWFTSGGPKSVQQAVKATVQRAAGKRSVPVLVAYNVPGRDCSQYSAGGADTGDDYRAWIDGFAAGIGGHEVIVILEPDGLALTPTDCGQPDTFDRVGLIRYAIDAIGGAAPNAAVYLDAGHGSWHSVGDIADRLVTAGIADTAGFYLNPSNYQFTTNSVFYGTWISQCIAYATVVAPGDFGNCPNQYWNGGPPDWVGTALSPYGTWSDDAAAPELWTGGITTRYADMLGGTAPTTHFVVDTSRNGQGPWAPPPGAYPDPQDWCNPPDRGLGVRPTRDTGSDLVDAFLWIKIPGESDGECLRGTPGPEDPARGMVDPAAGQWFPEMALELVHNANPTE